MIRTLLIENRDDLVEEVLNFPWGDEFLLDTCRSGKEAFAYLQERPVDLILVGNQLPDMPPSHFVSRLRSLEDYQGMLVVMISDEKDHRRRIEEMNCELDDYIRIPAEPLEVLTRIRTLLQETRALHDRSAGPGFSGDLSEMTLVDLLQMMELGRKTGIIRLQRDLLGGEVFIKEGEVWACATGSLTGERALQRLFSWTEGRFTVTFERFERERQIERPIHEILEKGQAILAEWKALVAQVPNLGIVYEFIGQTREDLSPDCATVAGLLDGRKTLRKVLQTSPLGDLATPRCVLDLQAKGMLREILPDLGSEIYPAAGESEPLPPVRSSDLALIIDDLIKNMAKKPGRGAQIWQPEAGEEARLPQSPVRANLALSRAELQYLKRKLL